MRAKLLAILAFCIIFATHPAHAQNNIQLMPPTYYGTTTPCVSSTTPNNQILFLGSTGQGSQSAINCMTGNGVVINPANNFFGIGTATPQTSLDVAGPVRTNDSTTVCSATTGGAIRYNTTTNVFEGCVDLGGIWQWEAFGVPSCGGIPGLATSSATGVACQPVCPAGNVPAYAPNITVPVTGSTIGQVETANDSTNCLNIVFSCSWSGWQFVSSTPTGNPSCP